MRNNSLVKGLCASNTGYFVEEKQTEFRDFLISLKQRIASNIFLYENMLKQYNENKKLL